MLYSTVFVLHERLCASLIKVHPLPAELTSELNLICALDILNEFDITMLPINGAYIPV